MIYSLSLTSKKDVGFLSVGGAVRTDTITFRITNLSIGDTFQWFVKANTTDADIDAIAGDTGSIDQSTENITFALPSADFTVGSTYYFALREFDGAASQEVIQVSFTISQNAVLGQGTSILNISPLFLPNFTTAGRDAIVTGSNALLIYNTDPGVKEIQQYNPDTDTWGALGSGGVISVNGQTGVVVLTKSDVGLGNADNTSDANKPVSTAVQTALDLKAPLASPTFTGTLSATGSDNTTIVARSDSNTEAGTIRVTGESNGLTTYRGGFVKYNALDNKVQIGSHEASNELTTSDITAIEIDRTTGAVVVPTTFDSTGNITTGAMVANGSGFFGKSGATNILSILRQASPSNASAIFTALGGIAFKGGTSTPATSNLDLTVKSNGIINMRNVPNYTSNANALAGGLVAGDIYRNAGALNIVI